MKTYSATYVEKLADKDTYEQGCEGKSRTIITQHINLQANSFPALVRKAKAWAGNLDETNYVFMPDGEESEHFGFNQQENCEGNKPTANQIEAWKRGEIELYLCDYTFLFEVTEGLKLTKEDLVGLTVG